MVSKVLTLQKAYCKFTEVLPEELNDNAKEELNSTRSQLESFISEDLKLMEELILAKKLDLKLDKFEDNLILIRRGFVLKNEQIKRESEIINFFIAHLIMCKNTLLYLSSSIIESIPSVKKQFDDYNRINTLTRDKRIAFINLTRMYQETIGFAVNISDIISEYVTIFEILHKQLDPKYTIEYSQSASHIYDYELLSACIELLLRGNMGRFSSSPLLRSALEVIITRAIFSSKNSIKYKKCKVEILKDFTIKSMLNSIQHLGYDISIGNDAIRRLYEWGSVISHKAYRPTHASIWYAYFITNNIRNGVLDTKGKPISTAIDEIIEDLSRKNLIKIHQPTNPEN